MKILGIETSCDETGASVIEGNPGDKTVTLLSNVVTSSLSLHAKTGGIIPEVAAREQLKYIEPVIERALKGVRIRHSGLSLGMNPRDESRIRSDSGVSNAPQNDNSNIDAIAVTIGPGLIGSLLVGVETAKTLAYVWKKPIIPVNHLIGHMYANWLTTNDQRPTTIPFPALALIVSGGHTDLVLIKGHGKLQWISGTRDDAAGEAFDKIGRLLDISYPGGPAIAAFAAKFHPPAGRIKFQMFPRPMIDEISFDFSFSGLKTAALREIQKRKTLTDKDKQQLSAEVQQAIVDVLVAKTLKAAQVYKVKSILLSGGVAANDLLRKELEVSSEKLAVKFFAPAKNLCTDNAAMIAVAAFFNNKPVSWKSITADPSLHFS